MVKTEFAVWHFNVELSQNYGIKFDFSGLRRNVIKENGKYDHWEYGTASYVFTST